MSNDDFEYAVYLTDAMDWNLSEDDFKFMLSLEPKGCFIAIEDSKKVGITTTISYNKVGWIGNVIVKKDYQKRNIGSTLVKHSIKYLIDKGLESIGLYSYPDQVAFYKRLGFKTDSILVVLRRKALNENFRTSVKKVKKKDIQKIIDYDTLCFGTSRKKSLEPLFLNPENPSFVKIKAKKVLGFVLTKKYEKMAEIGPMVCQKGLENVAIDLLERVVNTLESVETFIYVVKENTFVLKTLYDLGFAEQFYLVKMFFGPAFGKDCVYAAESLERG